MAWVEFSFHAADPPYKPRLIPSRAEDQTGIGASTSASGKRESGEVFACQIADLAGPDCREGCLSCYRDSPVVLRKKHLLARYCRWLTETPKLLKILCSN